MIPELPEHLASVEKDVVSDTEKLCEALLKGIPYRMIHNETPTPSNELYVCVRADEPGS